MLEPRTHTPQIIDEDTEHFKVRLEHLLNVFKTDAVSEFMGMKRSMLDDQNGRVRADTEKYLRMYEQKHEELTRTREDLLHRTRECEVQALRVEKMADAIAREKRNTRTVRYLATPFALLLRYKEHRQVKKFKLSQAERANRRRLANKALNAWLKVFREESAQKRRDQQEKQLERETTEIANRYQKEIEMLREKLAEATQQIDSHEKNKAQLQDNLKKAFMKGICAMNFEAMSALQGTPGQDFGEQCFQEGTALGTALGTLGAEAHNAQNQTAASIMNGSSLSFGKKEEALSKSVVVFSQPKVLPSQPRSSPRSTSGETPPS